MFNHIVCPHCSAVNRVPPERSGDQPKCGQCHHALFTGKPAELDAAALQKQIARGDLPVLVDFWAPWCAPCRMMAPAYEAAAARLEPAVRVAKVNTEEEQALGASLGIRSIPTLVLFRDGKEAARQPGAMSEPDILRWVQSSLEK